MGHDTGLHDLHLKVAEALRRWQRGVVRPLRRASHVDGTQARVGVEPELCLAGLVESRLVIVTDLKLVAMTRLFWNPSILPVDRKVVTVAGKLKPPVAIVRAGVPGKQPAIAERTDHNGADVAGHEDVAARDGTLTLNVSKPSWSDRPRPPVMFTSAAMSPLMIMVPMLGALNDPAPNDVAVRLLTGAPTSIAVPSPIARALILVFCFGFGVASVVMSAPFVMLPMVSDPR